MAEILSDLVDALPDPDHGVRHLAVESLGRFPDERTIEPIGQRRTCDRDRGRAGRVLEARGPDGGLLATANP